MTPEELLQRCSENDEHAWTYAYNYVLRYLTCMNVAEADREDIAQDALRYFLEGRLSTVRNPRMFMVLLRLKAKGIFLQRVNTSRRNPTAPLTLKSDRPNETRDNPDIPPVLPDAEERIWAESAARIVRHAIAKTGEKCSRLLHYYYEYKYIGKKIKTLASDLGLKYEQMRLDIHRCNQKLIQQPEYRKLLEEYRAG